MKAVLNKSIIALLLLSYSCAGSCAGEYQISPGGISDPNTLSPVNYTTGKRKMYAPLPYSKKIVTERLVHGEKSKPKKPVKHQKKAGDGGGVAPEIKKNIKLKARSLAPILERAKPIFESLSAEALKKAKDLYSTNLLLSGKLGDFSTKMRGMHSTADRLLIRLEGGDKEPDYNMALAVVASGALKTQLDDFVTYLDNESQLTQQLKGARENIANIKDEMGPITSTIFNMSLSS